MNLDPRISQALIEAVDTRVEQLLRARPYTTYGVVASVDMTTGKATVKLSGDTVASSGFRFARPWVPKVDELVRVIIDPRGDRYIAGLGLSGTVDKIGLGTLTEPTNAIGIRFGADIELYRAAANELRAADGDTVYGDAGGRYLDKTSTLSIPNITYTPVSAYSTTPWNQGTDVVAYDGTDELVVARDGLYLAVGQTVWDHNTAGIRLMGFEANDTANNEPGTYVQARWPVTTDTNADMGFYVTIMPLVANDRVCMKVWQNSGGALNLTTASFGLIFLGY